MHFLEAFGKAVLAGVKVIAGIPPQVLTRIPGLAGVTQVVSKDLTEIANIVLATEVVLQANPYLTMDQIVAIEAPQIKQILLNSSLIAGKKIQDPSLIDAASIDAANMVAKILKALHPDTLVTVETQDLTKLQN